MTPEDAFSRLVADGYLSLANKVGWYEARKPPKKSDIAWYVCALKTLGAWSVGIDRARVEICCGSRSDEVLFRMRAEKP